MGKSTLHIATRRPNGNIGYISEALEIPEFFDLIRPIAERPHVLVDYSPVIKALHSLSSKADDLAIRTAYNSTYSYWQDSLSYRNADIRLAKCEKLTVLSNELINTFQARLPEKKSEFYRTQAAAQLSVVQSIKQDADMYIVTLLCLIHSKASLEIESFREDTVITGYGDFILSISHELYQYLLAGRQRSNFLRYLAFEDREKLPAHLTLLEPGESEDEFLLRTLREQSPSTEYDRHGNGPRGQWRQVSITYDHFDRDFIIMAEILKDLQYRARSLRQFIQDLKNRDVRWDNSDEAILALTKEVRRTDGQPFSADSLQR